jgi:predicted metal-dependent hydrolase
MEQNNLIPYTFKKDKRSKKIKIRISEAGEVIVTAPFLKHKKITDDLVKQEYKWIVQQKKRIASLVKSKKHTCGTFKENKEKAYVLAKETVENINKQYKYSYQNIHIRNQKTRWGSCSSTKNLSFNYKIIFLPAELLTYIITHELCHLKEMNHGPNFWNLIKKTIPNYKELHLKLKKIKL